MRIRPIIYLLFFIHLSLIAASNLNTALSLAGKNRGELEKVLAHYKLHPEDSLKYKAASFLIENMPGHYSFSDTAYFNRYYHAIDSVALIYKKKNYEEKEKLFEKTVSKFTNADQPLVEDITIIKSDYLIGHIDHAFRSWQKGEWAQHINFDDFCEYLLPYKVCETQSLDNWREYLSSYGDTLMLNRLHYCKMFQNSAYMACGVLNRNLSDSVQAHIKNTDMLPVRRMSTLLKVPYGVCDDYNLMALAIMRAHGVPVISDFIPQWPFRSLGHAWGVLLETSGKKVVLEGAGPNPGSPHKEDHPVAKVFRQTYARNKEIDDIYLCEKSIPETFMTPFMKDVTEEYQATNNIEIPALNTGKHQVAYLSVFNNTSWTPIHWAKIKNNKFCFDKMGRRVVYLPVVSESLGEKAFADPILVLSSGKTRQLKPDTTLKQSVRLFRKFPAFEPLFDIAARIVDGKMQSADDSVFSNPHTWHTVSELGIQARQIDLSAVKTNARYWRYLSPKGSFCNIAELFFYEKRTNKLLNGKIIGTPGSYRPDKRYAKEGAFDRDALTFFDAPQPDNCWVGMDFGKPVNVGRIVYLARNDGNCIEIGDKYELLYWADNKWKSLGRKIADNVMLDYDNCPTNALFLLHDLTKGREERIFTYENGEQVWW
jgi:hypothetical protein